MRRSGARAAIRTGALKLSVCVRVVGVRQPHGACSRFGTSYLLREFAESLAQVESVAQHVGSALRMAEQECEDRLVSLCCVATLACQNEVVAPVVGTLALSGCHVIQSDGGLVISEAAVGADGPVSGEQPLSGCQVGAAVGGEGSQLWFGVGVDTSFSAAPATPRSWCRALLPGGLPSRGGATRICSGFRHQKGLWYSRRTQPGAPRNRKSSTGRREAGGDWRPAAGYYPGFTIAGSYRRPTALSDPSWRSTRTRHALAAGRRKLAADRHPRAFTTVAGTQRDGHHGKRARSADGFVELAFRSLPSYPARHP